MFVVLGRRRRARMGTQNVLFNIFYELVERYVAIRVPPPRYVAVCTGNSKLAPLALGAEEEIIKSYEISWNGGVFRGSP